MRPNIFNLATKELTQDAFLTWLLQFADDSHKDTDEKLNQCGKSFVTVLIKSHIPDFQESISKVEAGRQLNNIDVWAKINERYLIIIEDKTNTSHHSNQLFRYKEIASSWCLENNYNLPICIYIKTGNESNDSLKKIKSEGFSVFNRKSILQILDGYPDIKNNIFIDFYERLSSMEKANNEFYSKEIGKWNGNDWQGFFQQLEDNNVLRNWHFVNNISGGFWNGLLTWDYWNSSGTYYPAYIQLEQNKLCFKISTHPKELTMPDGVTRSGIRNKLYNLIISKAKEHGFDDIKKPKRFGSGTYMTVAVVEKENWLGYNDSLIDINSVIKILNSYKDFIKHITN